MKTYKLLLVEDDIGIIKTWEDTIDFLSDYDEEFYSDKKIELVTASNIDEARKEVNNGVHAAIIDIKLNNVAGSTSSRGYYGDKYNSEEDTVNVDGSILAEELMNRYTIPVAVLSGTPFLSEIDNRIDKYEKGTHSNKDIIRNMINLIDLGLFDAVGRDGNIFDKYKELFWSNLYSERQVWMDYKIEKENSGETVDFDNKILRYMITLLQELIDEKIPYYTNHEVYIKPLVIDRVKTGNILTKKTINKDYIVLTPSCDLVPRSPDGKYNTDHIMLCEIEKYEEKNTELSNQDGKNARDSRNMIKNMLENRTSYIHFLPPSSAYGGGYINFRKIISTSPEELDSDFNKSIVKVQDNIIKDIQNRFSMFYSRQGQPDYLVKGLEKEIYKEFRKIKEWA